MPFLKGRRRGGVSGKLQPATIMTDKQIADQVYIEPLTLPVLEKLF